MTNLEKWENFFKRKKWKYKKFQLKNGQERLLLKTYHKAVRCHMFISETHLNYSFYKGYMTHNQAGQKMSRSKQTQYSLSIKYGNLNIFHKGRGDRVRNMALAGPATLLTQMEHVIKQKVPLKVYNAHHEFDYDRQYKTIESRVARNKMYQTLEFFLNINKIKVDKIDIENVLRACYPSMKNFPIHPTTRTSFIFRKPNLGFNAIIKKIFGHKSKLIGKLVHEEMQKFHDLMDLGLCLKSKLNRGEMEQLMMYMSGRLNKPNQKNIRRGSIMAHTKQDFLNSRKFARQFTSQQLMHLFTQSFASYEFQDAARQWCEHQGKINIPEKVQSWHHIHEEISRQYRRLGEPDYQFKIKKDILKIDGVQAVDGEIIVVPKTRYELLEWGEKMHNCIAGYHHTFNEGRTVLLGVKEGDQIKYNIEIRGGRVVQFMADRNHRADENVIKRYTEVFQQYNLIKENGDDQWNF